MSYLFAIKIKKALTLGLTAVFAFSLLTGCQSNNETTQTNEQPQNTETETSNQSGKTLVVYYSATGNTKAVAEMIAEETNGDLFEIEPAEPYPEDYSACVKRAKEEFQAHARHDDYIRYVDRWYEAGEVARQAMKDLKKGKSVSILGAPVRRQVHLVKHLPVDLVMDIWCKQQGIE